MNTLAAIKRTVTKSNIIGTNHTRKLLDVRGDKSWERMKLDLLDAGFYFYIGKKIKQFKYYAIVRSRKFESNYIGDIPDFALDRAELALSIGVKEITIHSMQPLPVTRKSTDPIMVGWMRDLPNSISNEYCYDSDAIEGVVLAAWDMEKEIELL